MFTGKERDAETQLDYLGARFFDSDVARFLSLDPKQMEFANVNPYNYVLGNPIHLIDPDGKAPTDPDPQDPNRDVIPFTPFKSIGNVGDVAYNINSFLYNGIVAGPVNLSVHSAAAVVNGATRIGTTVAWSVSAGFYYGAQSKTLPSFAYSFDLNGFHKINDPESSEDCKELCKSTMSLLLGQPELPGVPANKLIEAAVDEVRGQTTDQALELLLPSQPANNATKLKDDPKEKKAAPKQELPAWAPAPEKEKIKPSPISKDKL